MKYTLIERERERERESCWTLVQERTLGLVIGTSGQTTRSRFSMEGCGKSLEEKLLCVCVCVCVCVLGLEVTE